MQAAEFQRCLYLIDHDVLIIGAGLAGMRAALAARENGVDVALKRSERVCCADREYWEEDGEEDLRPPRRWSRLRR